MGEGDMARSHGLGILAGLNDREKRRGVSPYLASASQRCEQKRKESTFRGSLYSKWGNDCGLG